MSFMTKNWSCESCGIIFNSSILINIHSWSHASYEETPNFGKKNSTCFECNVNFESFLEWNNHALMEHCKYPFHCLFCSLTFSNLQYLTNHIIKMHTNFMKLVKKETKFLCILCGASFFVANALCQHIQSSHSQISLLLIDKEIYTQYITKTSHETPKRSILQSKNQQSNRVKTPIKRVTFASDIANTSLTMPINKYRCGLCGATFLHGIQLDRHRKEKHKSLGTLKPKFACGCCSAKFYNKKYVQNHIITHHKIEITPKKFRP